MNIDKFKDQYNFSGSDPFALILSALLKIKHLQYKKNLTFSSKMQKNW